MLLLVVLGLAYAVLFGYLVWRDHRGSGIEDGTYGHSDHSLETADPRYSSYPH